MTNALICWKCGASLAELPLPLGRLAECLACHAELHVCRMCEFYDPRVTNSCDEPRGAVQGVHQAVATPHSDCPPPLSHAAV
jgi:hypothetical protein